MLMQKTFNCLNCQAALHNIRYHCPLVGHSATELLPVHCTPFCHRSRRVIIRRGNHTGRSPVKGFYALAILPLNQHLRANHTDVRQVWYTDDSRGAGQIQNLRQWWNDLKEVGMAYGYHTNSLKTFLLVKPEFEERAGSGISVVMDGVRYLKSANNGTRDFVSTYIKGKVAAATSAIGKRGFHRASCFLCSPHPWFTRPVDISFAYLGVPGIPVGCPGCHNHPAFTTSLNRETLFSDEELHLLQLPC